MIDPLILCALMVIATLATLMIGFPVAFTLAGVALIFALIGALTGTFDLHLLLAFPQSIFGLMRNETLVAVPLFIFMGVMLERSRVADDLLSSLGTILRNVPGGLAVSVTIVGTLMAASTGIVGATVVTLGTLALPTMLRSGYSTGFASGSIAASGTLGQIIPPSILLILLGDQLSGAHQAARFAQGVFAPDTITVAQLFAGALVPGLVLAALYAVYQLIASRMMPGVSHGLRSNSDVPSLSRALVAPLMLIVAVLGSILGGFATTTEAAGVGAVGATVLAAYRLDPKARPFIIVAVVSFLVLILAAVATDLRPQRARTTSWEWALMSIAVLLTLFLAAGLVRAFIATARGRDKEGEGVLTAVTRSTFLLTAIIFAIVIGARLFSLVFRGLGGADFISEFLEALPGGAIAAVFLVMLTMFVLGFFMDFLEIIYIVVPVTAPVLLLMEFSDGTPVDPVWLGVMMAVVLQTSFLTPPFGLSLFYLRGVAPGSVGTLDIYRGIIPYVAVQLVVLGLIGWFPGLVYGLPRLIGGS